MKRIPCRFLRYFQINRASNPDGFGWTQRPPKSKTSNSLSNLCNLLYTLAKKPEPFEANNVVFSQEQILFLSKDLSK